MPIKIKPTGSYIDHLKMNVPALTKMNITSYFLSES